MLIEMEGAGGPELRLCPDPTPAQTAAIDALLRFLRFERPSVTMTRRAVAELVVLHGLQALAEIKRWLGYGN